jgi:hypothetical protein
MVLVLPTLFHVALLAIAAPFTPTNAGGSTYVFTITGPWGEPTCQESNSQVLGLEEILAVFEDEATCDDGISSTHAFTIGQIAITETGLAAFVDGGGYAFDGEATDAFSRHDYLATIDFDSDVDRRVRIDWSLYASGLGSVLTTVKRLGNIGGPNDPSQPIFDLAVNAYIDPIWDADVFVRRLPAGRWRCTIMSTHQSHSGQKGFKVGVAQLSNTLTVVPLGDVDGNGEVNTTDLLAVIGAWGACNDCLEDLDGDGQVGVSDVLQVIADW